MATAHKTCYICLNICERKKPLIRRRTFIACAQSSNGAGERSTATVDRPNSRGLEKAADESSVPDSLSRSVYEESLARSWPLSELSHPPVLKAVAVEFMAQVRHAFTADDLYYAADRHPECNCYIRRWLHAQFSR